MITSRSYTVEFEQDFIPVVSIVTTDVLVVDRNGIGVRHDASFQGSPTVATIKSFQWRGLYTNFVSTADFFIRITNLGNLSSTWLIGPAPTTGVAYVIWLGDITAFYITQSGDDVTDVRDGLVAAVNAASWGFSVTCTAVGADKIRIVTAAQTFWAYSMAKVVYKSGLYVTLSGSDYMISESQSGTGYPAIPAKVANYDFGDLVLMPSGLLQWLRVPSQAAYSLIEANLGTSNINNIPTVPGAVPVGECVIDQAQQRIYFDGILNYGEKIKVISK